ncbi:hypothetical protein D6D01_02449 [Aureobasidium pullulans]|uniref:Rhodopsin domain-containing protein n=1 Tax=Aureobasidium pullulans TaxID=5580 RepID=A0A4S9LSP7_AURPU|nr:hypothetical protein D6D01_02449 [Aureobasidium pullulans]
MEAGAGIVGFVWVLTAFSGGIVVARSVMKTIRFHGLAWEDYLMIISMLLAVVYGISSTLMYTIDFGKHAQHLAPFHSPKFAEYLYLCHAVGFMAPLFSRISFCLYMLRVLSTTSAFRRRSIHAFIALQLIVNVPITIFVFTQCGSFQNLWQHGLSTSSTSCVRHDIIKILALIAVVFNAVTDVYLTVLPAVVVWGIKVMTAKARLGLVATLGLSFFASIASVIKIYYVYALYTYSPNLHTVERLIMVMGVEINVVVIAASIPVLAPLFWQKSGQSRKGIYKDPVLPTYDISVEGTSKGSELQSGKIFNTTSSTKTFVGQSSSSKNNSVVTRTTEVFSENGTDTLSPTTPWDEMPEIVFLSDSKQ